LTLACILGLSIFLRGKKLAKEGWLTVEDIYEMLDKRVPLDTIRAWIRSKKLPAYKPGKAYLVRREDLDKFIQDSRTKPDDQP
jgi:excisionase family DNA binding protein